jgi:hypothetical protein
LLKKALPDEDPCPLGGQNRWLIPYWYPSSFVFLLFNGE